MNAPGRVSLSLGLQAMAMASSPPSFTLLTRYVPASTGVHGNKLTSQRGVTPIHCGGVLVVFASWRAASAPKVAGAWLDSAMSTLSASHPLPAWAGLPGLAGGALSPATARTYLRGPH